MHIGTFLRSSYSTFIKQILYQELDAHLQSSQYAVELSKNNKITHFSMCLLHAQHYTRHFAKKVIKAGMERNISEL